MRLLLYKRRIQNAYGQEDPVGSYGTGVEKVIAKMKEAGGNVKSKNYGPYRHEIQNEPVKEEYFKDLIEFFDSVTPSVNQG